MTFSDHTPTRGGDAGLTLDVMIDRADFAVEGEFGGLVATEAQAREIVEFVLTGLPPGSERDAAVSAILSRLAPAAGVAAPGDVAGLREADDGWQPIETAPMDGTTIDLWAKREKTGTWSRYTDCAWGRKVWGSNPIGDLCWLGLNDHYSAVTPTHWRPLPAAPSPTDPRDASTDAGEG